MKENSQSTDSMTSRSECFYADCSTSPSWGVESEAAPKNPDGSPWYLFACDDHEQHLTADLRRSGTKYRLFPVIGPPSRPKCPHVESYEEAFKSLPRGERMLINGATILATVLVAPPILIYYGVKWIFGWRPDDEETT